MPIFLSTRPFKNIFFAEVAANFSMEQNIEEQAVKKLFVEYHGEVVISKAECFINDISFQTLYKRPLFDPGFIAALEDLVRT